MLIVIYHNCRLKQLQDCSDMECINNSKFPTNVLLSQSSKSILYKTFRGTPINGNISRICSLVMEGKNWIQAFLDFPKHILMEEYWWWLDRCRVLRDCFAENRSPVTNLNNCNLTIDKK